MTRVVTFYSFKGGVGRTMALVNVAHVLARSGLRVLMVDFDLEAPGMTHFFADQVRSQKAALGSRDALDLLLEAKGAMSDAKAAENVQFDSIAEYVVQLPVPKSINQNLTSSSGYLGGRLDFLPATLEPTNIRAESPIRSDFLHKIGALNLPSIFSNAGPRHFFGQFVKNYFLSARFRTPADQIFTSEETVSAKYDIVLIDSRTGLGEISGLCVGPLSDAVVIFTGLNNQNISGTKYFMQRSGLLGPEAKPHLVVVGPVPPWHTTDSSQKKRRLIADLRSITQEPIEVPYHPLAAISEPIFVQVEPEDPIALAYETLAPRVVDICGFYEPLQTVRRLARQQGIRDKWTFLSRVADSLHIVRAEQTRQKNDVLRNLYLFPTAAGIAGLSRIKWGDEFEGADPLALGAGMSAYFHGQEAHLTRAWTLSDQLEGPLKRRVQSQLVLFQYRVFGSLPRRHDFLKQARSAFDTILSEGAASTEYPLTEIMDAVMAIAGSTLDHIDDTDERRQTINRLVKCLERRPNAFFFETQMMMLGSSRLVGSYLKLVLEVNARETRRLSNAAIEALHAFRLPREVIQGLSSKIRTHDPLGDYMRSEHGWLSDRGGGAALSARLPLLMMSGLALSDGAEATQEILLWLELARETLGFGWRALVNWNQFEALNSDSAWKSAISEEDRLVSQVEAAIANGKIAL